MTKETEGIGGRFLVGALILLLLVWGLWSWSGGRPGEPEVRSSDGETTDSRSVEDGAEAEAGTRLSAGSSPEVSESSGGASGGTLDSGEKGLIPVLVRVVEDATSKPIAGAEVTYLVRHTDWFSADTTTRNVMTLGSSDPFAYYRTTGTSARTDAEGLVRLPMEEFIACICRHVVTEAGQTRSLLGRLHLGGTHIVRGHVYELRLRRETRIPVRVVSLSGRPVEGVGIVGKGVWLDSQGQVTREEDRPSRSPLATTDAEGLAFIPDVDEWRGRLSRVETPPDAISLSPLVLSGKVDSKHVDFDDIPEEPIVLQLPQVGSVEFLWLDADTGERIGDGSGGALQHPESKRPIVGRAMGSGRTWFPFVESRGRYRVRARSATGRRIKSFEIDAPEPGATRTVEIRVESGDVVLVGRLEDSTGAPVGPAGLALEFGEGVRRRPPRPTTVDPDGRFRIDLSARWVGTDLGKVTLLQVDDSGIPSRVGEALVPILTRGTTDLGVLTMGDAPALLHGSVTLDGEIPERLPFLVIERRAPEEEDFELIEAIDVDWVDTSSFSVRMRPRTGRFRIRAVQTDAVDSDWVEFDPGASDVRIALARGASVDIRTTIPTELKAQLRWSLAKLGDDGSVVPDAERALPTIELSERRRVLWNGLSAGRYELRLDAAGRAGALYREVLELAPGETFETEIEASSDLRTYTVRAVPPQGVSTMELSTGMAWAGAVEPGGFAMGRRVVAGRSQVLGAPGEELWVVIPGHPPARAVLGEPIEIDVPLQGFGEVEVQIPASVRVPSNGVLELRVQTLSGDLPTVIDSSRVDRLDQPYDFRWRKEVEAGSTVRVPADLDHVLRIELMKRDRSRKRRPTGWRFEGQVPDGLIELSRS